MRCTSEHIEHKLNELEVGPWVDGVVYLMMEQRLVDPLEKLCQAEYML